MMTNSSDSPFDVALARPFLDEPTRKKWSIHLPKPSASWLLRRSDGRSEDPRNTMLEAISFESNSECDEEENCPLLHPEHSTESGTALRSVRAIPQQPEDKGGNILVDMNNNPTLSTHDQRTTSRICTNTGHNISNKNANALSSMTVIGQQPQARRLVPPSPTKSPLSENTGHRSPSCASMGLTGRMTWSHTLEHGQGSQYFPSNRIDVDVDGEVVDDEMMMELVPLTSPTTPREGSHPHDVETGADGLVTTPLIMTLDGNVAIMAEREAELSDIASSMRQIHGIQQDFAKVVDSQGSRIQQLSWQSIEAFGHAQSGMEHLVKTMKNREERKTRVYSIMMSAVVVMAFCYIVAGFFVTNQNQEGDFGTGHGGNKDDEQGQPMFLIPITTFLP